MTVYSQSFSPVALVAFGARQFLVVGAVLSTVACLTVPLASTHQMLVVLLPRHGNQVSPDTSKCPQGGKITPQTEK